jgi:hypothetical protein
LIHFLLEILTEHDYVSKLLAWIHELEEGILVAWTPALKQESLQDSASSMFVFFPYSANKVMYKDLH